MHCELCLGAVSVPSAVLGAAPKAPLPIALAKRILAECGAKTWLRQWLACTAGHPAVCWGRVCQESGVTLEMSDSGSCATCWVWELPLAPCRCRSVCSGWIGHCFCSVCRSVCWGSAGEGKGSGKEERFCIMLKCKSHL